MSTDLEQRAARLDQMRSKRISEKLTLEEAQNIVNIWGIYLEHSGGIRYLFGINIPESFLPYPIDIIQGALNKMEAYYYGKGQTNKVKPLEETEMLLVSYIKDEEAIRKLASNFDNIKWRDVYIPGLQNLQKSQAENGYLIDKKLWKLSKSRIEELEKKHN